MSVYVFEGPEKPYQLDMKRIYTKDDTQEVMKAFKIKDPIVASAISSTIVNNANELKLISDIEKQQFQNDLEVLTSIFSDCNIDGNQTDC